MSIRLFFSAIAVVAMCVIAAGADDGPSTLFSENFDGAEWSEGIPSGWDRFTSFGEIAPSTEHSHSGTRGLKLIDRDAKQAVGLRSPHIPVDGNIDTWVTCRYFSARGQNQSIYIEFWAGTDGQPGKRLSAKSFPCPGQGQWVRVVGRARAPADAAFATIHMNSYSTNQAVGFFDDVAFGTETNLLLDRTPRTPAPVSHPCGLYKAEDVARAKKNVERHEWARKTLESFVSGSTFWMECPDEKIPYWIPELTPFRVVDCPACGAGWRFAWENTGPESLRCRKCGFSWPNDDYRETESQQFTDPLGQKQTIPYYKGKPSTEYGADRKPVYRLSGRVRYHRIGKLASLGNLGKAYALTDTVAYAEKVRSVLLRLADVYPHYLPHDWNNVYPDYSNLQSGKLSGWKLHDAGVFIQLATAYDLTYNSGVYSDRDKTRIEEGCFREFARLMTATSPRGCCINDGPTAMAAGALAGLMLGSHRVVAWAIEPPSGFIGFLEEYFARDGHWYESSASYEGMSLAQLYVTPESLRGYTDPPGYDRPDRYDDLDLFEHPLMKKILVAAAKERMPDGCLPATNDSTFGARYPRQRAEQNYFWYPTDKNMALMAWAFDGKADDEGGEYSLFRRPPNLDLQHLKPAKPNQKSTVSPGPGFGIVRTGGTASDAALLIDFGPYGGGHGHPDKLNVVYYDFAHEMVTDLGYLGWGHPNHPWIRSTAAHNLVLVDGKPQNRTPGQLDAFGSTAGAHAVIASAPAIYGDDISTYRRSVLLVDHGPGRRYVADLFHVRGGTRHQYLFHGDGDTLDTVGLGLEDAAAADLGDPAAGWTHVNNVRKAQTPESTSLTWRDRTRPLLATRLHVPAAPDTTLWTCTAPGLRNRRTPFATRDQIKAVIERPGPENLFATVFEALNGDRGIHSVTQIPAETQVGNAVALEVRTGAFRDIVIFADQNAAQAPVVLPDLKGIQFQGRVGLVSLRNDALQQLWMLGGSRIQWEDTQLTATPEYHGVVQAVDTGAFTLAVNTELPRGKRLRGAYLVIDGRADGAYEINDVEAEDNGVLVHLAGEPIINAAPNDTWTLVTSAGIRVEAEQRASVSGTPDEAHLRLAAAGTPLYARPHGGAWKPVNTTTDNGSTALDMAADWADAPEIDLLCTDNADILRDKTPPALQAIEVDGSNLGAETDIGYLADVNTVRMILNEPAGILPGGLGATVRDEGTGAIHPVDAILEPSSGTTTVSVNLPLAPLSLPPSIYSIQLSTADLLGNRSEWTICFNTLGIARSLEDAPVKTSSGKLTKNMPSLHTRFYRSEAAGDFVTFEFDGPPETGPYQVDLIYTMYSGYGIMTCKVDGKPCGDRIDAYSPQLLPSGGTADLGTHDLTPGPHTITLETVGRNSKATDHFIGVCRLVLKPAAHK